MIIDSLSYVPTAELLVDMVASLPPQMARYLKDVFGPRVAEMMAVAWRNPNIYVDIASYMPKYLSMPGSGWEPLMNLGNSILQDRVLFGSTWLFMGQTIKQLADGVRELPIKEEVKDKWLYHNAVRLFGIQ